MTSKGWRILAVLAAAQFLMVLDQAVMNLSISQPGQRLPYGVLGGVSGAGIAVGPILGGWVTTNLTWRLVFAGEVVVVIAILLAVRVLPSRGKRPGAKLDVIGAVLCSLGLALVVLGILEASTWGWLAPRNSRWSSPAWSPASQAR